MHLQIANLIIIHVNIIDSPFQNNIGYIDNILIKYIEKYNNMLDILLDKAIVVCRNNNCESINVICNSEIEKYIDKKKFKKINKNVLLFTD